MKNHIKLASLLFVVSILLFAFVGCQTKKTTPAVATDVSSDIISSSSDISSSSNISTVSSASSIVSSKTATSSQTTKTKASVTQSTSTNPTQYQKRADAIASENQRHTDALKSLETQYNNNVAKYTAFIEIDKQPLLSWYHFNGGEYGHQQIIYKNDKTYLNNLKNNCTNIQKYNDDSNELHNIQAHYPYAIKQENQQNQDKLKLLQISD